ncbi:NACHT, LRR and PYD domains-containing protein 12-like [Rana temporaria]|uniref:NACHT, LRR and PYD domains-containing protein 12-like n=1 Tax=Rana temporaria TaxID=8407 RepID=UPI001AACA770|nr:NACHT, LRR and PYD domains-containing protein 12-like [Rana temporaria]
MKRSYPSESPENIRTFSQQLSGYDDPSLRRIYEYYRDDLIHILENMDTGALLKELKSRNVLSTDTLLTKEKHMKRDAFSRALLQDIQDRGREAVIGLWECLYALQKDHPHPNLLAVLEEIGQTGEGLVNQILQEELGPSLTPELKDIQKKHKQHLMEKTETLVEHRPPGTTLEPQRFLINERYVNMVVVSIDQFRERPQNELIQTGVKHEECLKETQTKLEHISPNKLFRWNHQSHCAPHAVMVSGVPGIGKTTMMQKFVYDWVTGKHYQRFAFLFFFRFRDLNRLGEVSLEEMILHQYPYLESQIGNILQDPERLLFIFDGLDESIHQMDFRSSRLFAYRTKCGEIVVSLVRQKLLEGCSVLMTSRPTRLASVDTGVFQRIAEIMGFLHEDRLTFFNNFFGNEELSGKAFHHVQENDTLYTFCYIPSYCWIICTVLSMCFRAQPITDQLMTSLPKTVTQLFVTFVSNILANHSQNRDRGHTDRDLLTSIGWMAEHGVMNHMIVFDERHLESFSVRNDNHLFSSFMMESGQPPDVDFTFLHLTLQEFFAALFHFINYNPYRLQETLDKTKTYKDGRAEIFLRFLCGLSDSSTRSMLKSHVGELSTQAARHVISWIQKKTPEQRSEIYSNKRKDLLKVFYYLYESRNTTLVSQCFRSNTVHFSEVPLSPLDCSVLSFILQSCGETEEVNIQSCNIQSEGLRKLIPALHNIKSLSLSYNHLTDSSCPYLASVIRNNQTLRTLDLSINNLEGPHLRDLMEALTTSRIEELQLYYNDLTDSSCPHLASGIRNNQTLRILSLYGNNLDGPHFRDLMEALTTSRIEELRFSFNTLTDSSCLHLASVVRNNQTLRILNLCGTNLKGPHFRKLMKALTTSRIEELQLPSNNLTDSSCPHLASGIRNNQTLRTLNLSHNHLEGPHFRDLMEALTTSRIEELQLYDNDLTDSSCPHLASGIRNNQTLRTLNLSKNNLEGPHFRDLIEALTTSRIEKIDLTSNHLTDSACPHLASGIRNNQTLRKLDLSTNNLEGPHFRDLMEALTTSRIEELHLDSNHLEDSSCPHLASGIRNNQTLRTLSLSWNYLKGHCRDLMEALTTSRIEELQLDRNHLTDSSCPHLASVIRNNQTLRRLDLSVNNLEGPHFRDLMEALPTSRIEELQLSYNQLTDSSCPHLASGIRNTQILRRLNLSDNNLEGPHFRELMEALTTSRIEELLLRYNHLTNSSCPHLASGIRNNQTLRTLDLSYNTLEGPHFRDLMEALTTSQIEKLQNLMEALTTSRIEKLQLENNDLTDNSCPHLASGIRNNQTLRTLSLSYNNLEGPHFRDLMEALTTSLIEELLLDRNQLTDSSCPYLASGIRNNQTLRRLNLAANNLEGPHFRDLLVALTTSRIEKWHLDGNHLQDSSFPPPGIWNKK